MACLRWMRIYKVQTANRPTLVNPVCRRGPRTIENISKLLFSIWKKIDFQGFLGIDVSREEGGGLKEMSSQRNVQRTFLGKKLICESSLIKTGLCTTKKLKGDVDVPN